MLAQAQLRDTFSRQKIELDSTVGEGGGTLSVGQRQLLCFARAVLGGSRLLVRSSPLPSDPIQQISLCLFL